MKRSFVVLSHDSSSNALGRAQSLALTAQELGPTQIWAADNGKWWNGVTQFPTDNQRVGSRGTSLPPLIKGIRTPGDQLVVWVTKGIHPLPRWERIISRIAPDAVIILDVDDDDIGLAEEYRAESTSRRLRLNRARRGHPERIRRSQRALWGRVHALTYASSAVRTRYPDFTGPSEWVPHVRANEVIAREDRKPNVKARVGVFGTIRPHKGRQIILDLIRDYRDIEVHSFADCGLGTPERDDFNWIEIEPTTPLSLAYSRVDAALLPMSVDSMASDVQFPAKLVDAMRAGVAIVATPTSAVREIGLDGFVALSPRPNAAEARAAILAAVEGSVGQRARQIYLESLTPESAAARLSWLIEGIHANASG